MGKGLRKEESVRLGGGEIGRHGRGPESLHAGKPSRVGFDSDRDDVLDRYEARSPSRVLGLLVSNLGLLLCRLVGALGDDIFVDMLPG